MAQCIFTMLQKTNGIVLHYLRYGETSVISHIYTEAFGRQSFIAAGVRSKHSKLKLNLFQPLTLINLEAYFKNHSELHRIKEANYFMPFYTIGADIRKSSVVLFLAELLDKTLREAEPNERMFGFIWNAIQVLEMTDKDIGNFHLVFMLHLSKYLGIFPSADQNINLELTTNRVTDFPDSNDRFFSDISAPERKNLMMLYNCSFQTFSEIHLDHNTRNYLLSHIINHYQYHFENMSQLKSLPILREVLH